MFSLLMLLLIVFGIPLTLAIVWRKKSKGPSFSQWWNADRDRTQSAREIAQRYGLTFVGLSPEERNRVQHFFVFRHHPRATVDDLVVGESPAMRESLFTYYETIRWRSTFAYFDSPRLDLPAFRMTGRGYPLRDLTLPAIAFDDSPEFNSSYEVRGEDEAAVRRLLDDRVLRRRLADHHEMWIEGKGSELLCGRSMDYTQTGERDAFFVSARAICALFARFE